jgi:hypothetical protein
MRPLCPLPNPHCRDISVKAESEGTFDGFWETLAFIVNAMVFAYAGAATVNFFIRWGQGTCSTPGCARAAPAKV